MSKEGRKRRQFIIRLKQKRKKKIKKLREKYKKAKTETEKRKIIEKALRINPYLNKEQFLKFIK